MTIKDAFKKEKCGHKEFDISLKKYTTYQISNTTASLIISPRNMTELRKIIEICQKNEFKFKILGNGSNLIFTKNYNGVLIKLDEFDDLKIEGTRIIVGAGYNLTKLSLKAANESLAGLEFATGIPGTIGGAVFMNAGAYKSDMGYIVESVTAMDENMEIVTFRNRQLNFHYRTSYFKENPKYIILEATLKLKKGTKKVILDVINDRRQRRIDSQPLEYPSAGSVFRNPENEYAGHLIEECGLKGFNINGAEVSTKHANFIINKGGATGKDIKNVIIEVQKQVKDKYNVDLKLEQEIVE